MVIPADRDPISYPEPSQISYSMRNKSTQGSGYEIDRDHKELRAGAQAQRRQYIAGVGFLARCQIWKNHFTSNKVLFLRTRRGAIYPHCQI